MTDSTSFDTDFVFDILRGIAAFTQNDVVANLAATVARYPRPDLAVAFNQKQIASKAWLRDSLFDTLGGAYERIWVLGGWYGVLSALLFDDPRFSIGGIDSIDVDPGCVSVAESLNAAMAVNGRFKAITADMETLSYEEAAPTLVINTSCEHVADLSVALGRMPAGMKVVLQSNNYRREPDHVSCVDSLGEFEEQARLAKVLFRGELVTKNYTRFMLIGER